MEASNRALADLQSEVNVLKERNAPKASFLYGFKMDPTEPDHQCRLKVGRSKDVDVRQGPYLQLNPNGRMVVSVEVPTPKVKEAELMVHKLLKLTGGCVNSEVYCCDVELVKLVIQMTADLFSVLSGTDGGMAALREAVHVFNHHLRGAPRQNGEDTEALNASDLQAIRYHLGRLEPANSPDCIGVESENDVTGGVDVAEGSDGTLEDDPIAARAKNFNLFISECCELVSGHNENSITLVGRPNSGELDWNGYV